jgi:hypothetical protein
MMSKKYYILFDSYNWGLMLEAKLKSRKIKYTIAPTPRQFAISCGMSIIYNKEDEEEIKTVISEYEIQIKGFFELDM